MTTYKSEFLYVTTIGHKTGAPHEIEIWFCEHAGAYYLCAERRERTHWVQNIQHHPAVTFWVKGQTYTGRGRVIDVAAEPELAKTVSDLFDAKYNWSDGLLVELRVA